MGLNCLPVAYVSGDSAEFINSHIQSWELVDSSGWVSDQLTLVLAGDLSGAPSVDSELRFFVGYRGSPVVDKGRFIITKVTQSLLPKSVTIVATAAAFKVADASAFRLRRSVSYENISLGDLFRQLVSRHGYKARVAPDLNTIMLNHVDQSNETDMSFLTRMAKQFDAVAKPVDGIYVLARRGQVKNFSGQSLSPVAISLSAQGQSSLINVRSDVSGRTKFKGVVVSWFDAIVGEQKQVKIGSSPFKQVRKQYDSAEIAKTVAEAGLRKLVRTGVSLSLELPGNPLLSAEGLIELDGSVPAHMRGVWSVDKVVSQGSRSGAYLCTVSVTSPI